MAQVYNCKLTRNDPSCSWGFRLQGGKDFGTPLLIQKVNVGSLAERAGLQVGDAVLRVNNKDVSNEKHKDAQDIIIRAGNSFEITVQRGGLGTWRPSVTPVGSIPSPNPFSPMSPTPVTKTSLAAPNNRAASPRAPHGFNSSMKPFSPQMNGATENGNGPVKAIVNNQYNSPVGIYSDESIAETLSAQAEVLAGGVLGVNFKKNEKDYNAEGSEVFKMVQEAEKEHKTPEPDTNGVSSPVAGLRHVSPPKTTNTTPSSESSLTPGKNICADCERLIVGVFVRIKDKNLHVECFKCATCGTSLKNAGYYSINNKLYCDIHAKMIAKQHPPAPNLEPVTSSPHLGGATKPFKPLSPQPSTLTPAPFHTPRLSPTRTLSPSFQNQNNASFNGTKPFQPMQTNNTSAFKPGFQLPQPKPFHRDISPKSLTDTTNTSAPQYSSYFNATQQRLPFLKPKAEKASAFMPVMKSTTSVRTTVYDLSTTSISSETTEKVTSSVETTSDSRLETVLEGTDNQDEEMKTDSKGIVSCDKRQSICSQEITRVLCENKCSRNLSALVDQTRPESPVPSESADEFSTFEYNKQNVCEKRKTELFVDRPRSVRSISPAERPTTPSQIIVFPPPLPEGFHKARAVSPKPRAISPTPRPRESEQPQKPTIIKEPETEPVLTERVDDRPISLQNSPPLKFEPGIITTLLTTAPTRPFTPIEPAKATIFTEDVPLPKETVPYLPETDASGRRTPRAPSPLVSALTVGTERSYSPLPTPTDYHDFFDKPTPETPVRPSMADALAIAPLRSYSTTNPDEKQIASAPGGAEKPAPDSVPDLSDDPSLILTRPSLDPVFKKKDPPMTYYSSLYCGDAFFPPITQELKAKFEKKKRTGSFSSKKSIERSSPAGSLYECSRISKTVTTEERTPAPSPSRRPLVTDTGLYKAVSLPHYQHCVKELAARNAKKTPSSSRRSTPMQSDRPTPISFDATVVSTQQRTFNTEVAKKLESRPIAMTSSTASFLTQTTDISEKVTPALGYQPCPMVERASFEKIEKCVQNLREGRVMERSSVSPSNSRSATSLQRPSSVVSVTCSESGSCTAQKSSSKSSIQEKSKRRARSRTCRTPDLGSTNIRPSPLALPPCTSESGGGNGTSIIVTPSGAQCFRPPPSPITVVPDSKPQQCGSASSSAAVSLLSRQLSKTLSALTSANNVPNLACSNRNLSNLTSNSPNANPQAGGTVGDNLNSKLSNGGTAAGFSAPRRGKGVWNPQNLTPGARIPQCANCNSQIRGPFVTALGKIWCPEHFVCVNSKCGRSLLDIGFVEEPTGLYCEYCFEQYLAPQCGKCNQKIKGDCLNGIGKHFHPECFSCAYCGKKFGNNPFFLEEGLPYCENDWNELFTTKCFACGFPIEAGDRWVEALNNNYHSPCFNCSICKTNLEGQSFYAKGGRPFCKTHSR